MRHLSVDMIEVWRDIPGYEGKYQASTLGGIRSLTRQITQTSRWGTDFTRTVKGHVLRPGRYCEGGHVSVVLGKGANGSPVHQLVLLTFEGPPPSGQEVRHLNGIPTDNRLENLVYGTRTNNILDVFYLGRPWRKLTISDALHIRSAIASGETGASLALQFNVSQTAISRVKVGRTFWWLA